MKIQVENLFKGFGEKVLLSDISFEISNPSIVSVTGESGSGKSTLLNCLGLLENINSGAIYFDNTDVSQYKGRKKIKLYKDTVGFLFQNYALIEEWSVLENLLLATTYKRGNKKSKIDLVQSVLQRIGLQEKAKVKVFTLSGGEQQRVAIAKLMLKQPKLVFCDEPTSALDEHNTKRVLGLLRDLSLSGSTVLVSTHDTRVVDFSDSVLCIRDKKIEKIR